MMKSLVEKLSTIIDGIDRKKCASIGQGKIAIFCSSSVGGTIKTMDGFAARPWKPPSFVNFDASLIGAYKDIYIGIVNINVMDSDDMRIYGEHGVLINLVLEGFSPNDFL